MFINFLFVISLLIFNNSDLIFHRTMSILETELKELQQCVPRVIADSTVEACVPAMVRVKIEYVLM